MLGDYIRAALIFTIAGLFDMYLAELGKEFLGVASCPSAPIQTNMCSQTQLAIDYFLVGVALSLIVYLLFAAWRENQAVRY